MDHYTRWMNELQQIPGTNYYSSKNGNIYCNHCLFIQSGPLHAKQISDALEKLIENKNFVVYTVIHNDMYSCKSYVWFDNEKDFRKIIAGELIIPPFELEDDQIASIADNILIDGKYFTVSISATYITPSIQEGKRDDQFFINNVGEPQEAYKLLHYIFDRFAISSPERKVKINVSEKSDGSGQYWALVQFANHYDCAFAHRLTKNVTCRDSKGNEKTYNVSYGKVLRPPEPLQRKNYFSDRRYKNFQQRK